MKKFKNKKIWCVFLACILSICMCVPAFGMDDYGGNPNTVPKTKSYGYEYATDWGTNDYSNVTDYPFISYTGKIVNKTNIQYFTDYRVFGIDLSKYICVGYTYMYGGFKFLTVLAYDKDTKEYISAVPTYHKMCSQDIILDDGTLKKHEDVEGGSLGFDYSEHILDTNVPIFDSKLACDDYAKSGIIDGAVALPDDMVCVPPVDVDIFSDDNDSNKLYCTWKQNDDDDISNYNSYVTYDYEYNYADNLSSPYPPGNIVVDTEYKTSTYNKVLFDISKIVKKADVGKKGGADSCIITLNVYNFDTSGKKAKSETCSIRLKVTENGVYRMNRDTTTGLPDWSQPVKSETDYIKDNGYNYTPDDFVPVIGNDNTSFVNNILTGFGLLGNGGFLVLFSRIFNYIPTEIWDVIKFYFSIAVLVALFKLIIK